MSNSQERRKINGEWVKALRKDLKLSQEELADKLGVSRSAVARWEADAFRPTKLAAKVLLEYAEQARGSQGAGQLEASSLIAPHVPHEARKQEVPHSQRREGSHDPDPTGNPDQ